MVRKIINVGSGEHRGDGESLREAFIKINENFSEIYNNGGAGGATGFTGSQGIQGFTGFTGSQGEIGFTGFTGSQGIIGYTGSAAGSGPSLIPQTNFIMTLKSVDDQALELQEERPGSVVHDNLGNIFLVGQAERGNTSSSLNPSIFVTKIDPTGTVLWTSFLGITDSELAYDYDLDWPFLSIDSNGSPFVSMQSVSNATYAYQIEVAKLDPDNGAIVWNRNLADTTNEVYSTNIVVDREDNLYVVYYALNAEGNYSATITKYTNSGSLIWTKDLESNAVTGDGSDGIAAVDYENNLVLWTKENITNNPDKANTVIKLDSNGNILWQKTMSKPGTYGYEKDWFTTSIAIDKSNSIYVLGYDAITGFPNTTYYYTLSKLNSNGVLQWQKQIDFFNPDSTSGYLALDQQDNLYSISWNSIFGEDNINIVKISPAGNVIWARKFYEYSPPYGDDRLDDAPVKAISIFNNKMTFATTSTYYDGSYAHEYSIIAQLPTDGTCTGRYGNFYYLNQNVTLTPVSFPLSDGEMQVGNSTVVDSNGTLIPVTYIDPLTSELITIGPGAVIPSTLVNTVASAATLNWDSNIYDYYAITAQAENLTISADSSSPITGKKVIFRIKDDGTNRAITWTTGVAKGFRAIGVTLPTTTTASKTMYVEAMYNETDSRWDVIRVSQET